MPEPQCYGCHASLSTELTYYLHSDEKNERPYCSKCINGVDPNTLQSKSVAPGGCKVGQSTEPLPPFVLRDIKEHLEKVDHPEHYGGCDNPYETIKIIEAKGWLEGFCKGSALKYLMRAGDKPSEPEEDDLSKCEWYVRYWRNSNAFIEKREARNGRASVREQAAESSETS